MSKKKSNLKILLVVPRYTSSEKPNYVYSFPLGLAYISAVMKEADYDVTCININHLAGSTENILHKILDNQKYDVVATGHVGIGYSMIEKIIKSVRNHNSRPKIILGGVIVTSEPELMFESLRPDFAVIGEGEITIIDLLECIEKKKDFKKVEGIIYKNSEGETIKTKLRKPIENIDEIPFPDFDGLEFEKIFQSSCSSLNYACNYHDYPRVYPIMGSRGCPFRCTFCYHCLGDKYRERSMKNLMDEIEWAVEKYKINSVFIYDDLFSYRKERIYEFCGEMKKLSEKVGEKIRWSCQLSVLHVDKELLKIMKDAGCETISYGFESFSEEVLRSMRKPITPEKIDVAFKATLEAKIGIQANFIFGDFAETKQTAIKTLNYWKKNCKGQVNLGFIYAYPGSELYNNCLKKGIIKDKLSFIKNEMKNEVIINMTDAMNESDFEWLKKEVDKLMRKVVNISVPLHVKKMSGVRNKNRHEVLAKCPFCKEKTYYKNFYLRTRYIYRSYTMCRNCNMRYYLVSPLFRVLMKFGLVNDLLRKYHAILRRKIV